MSKYTRADFETARFAKHHNGSVASRRSGLLWPSPWLTAASESYSDSNMADNGWVPVPDQVPGRTITKSISRELFEALGDRLLTLADFEQVLHATTGTTVTPDPEPTNAEKLERALKSINHLHGSTIIDSGRIAELLDEAGVKAPTDD